jgi:hypothetical protein
MRAIIAPATAVRPQQRTKQHAKALEHARLLQLSVPHAPELGNQLLALGLGRQLLATARQLTVH